tara:strand:- start:82 stop:399 length:318 start_codon:yes stop_codon:yes gene_type:complete
MTWNLENYSEDEVRNFLMDMDEPIMDAIIKRAGDEIHWLRGELNLRDYTEDSPFTTWADDYSLELSFYFKEIKGFQMPYIKINGDEMEIGELVRLYVEVRKEKMR